MRSRFSRSARLADSCASCEWRCDCSCETMVSVNSMRWERARMVRNMLDSVGRGTIETLTSCLGLMLLGAVERRGAVGWDAISCSAPGIRYEACSCALVY